MYLQLPFELAPVVASYRRLVVPPRHGSRYAGWPSVHLRFHEAPEAPRTLDDRALTVALARSPSAERATRALGPWLEGFGTRLAAPTRQQVSVVEVETAVPAGQLTPAVSQDLAEYSLQALNRFLDTYQVLTEQSDVHHLNPDNLGPELVIELRRRCDRATGRLAMPQHQAALPHEKEQPAEHLLPLLVDALRREPNNHPLDLVRRLQSRASRFAELGEYEPAIEALQTSAERLVFALHQLLLSEEGHTAEKIEQMMPETFSGAVKRLSHDLGGNWNTTGVGPVAKYWTDLYLVRNRVAHVGITPGRDAVPDAFEGYAALWKFVMERTLAERARKPRTALALHGGIGLRKAGALDRRMREFIAEVEARGESDSFWLPVDQR